MNEINNPEFAPQLTIKNGVKNIAFYTEGLGAVELNRLTNDDGTIHVAEFSIGGNLFHLHEESLKAGTYSPEKNNGTTVIIGLFVSDVDAYMNRAIAAGASEISPAQDYDYGYRQGQVKDPFGHIWMFEMKIQVEGSYAWGNG